MVTAKETLEKHEADFDKPVGVALFVRREAALLAMEEYATQFKTQIEIVNLTPETRYTFELSLGRSVSLTEHK